MYTVPFMDTPKSSHHDRLRCRLWNYPFASTFLNPNLVFLIEHQIIPNPDLVAFSGIAMFEA